MLNRISLLGSTGVVLLQLVACSAEPRHKQDSATSNERIDIQDGTTTDLTRTDDTPDKPATCDYHAGEPLNLETLKWKNTLPRPRVFQPTTPGGHEYKVTVREEKVQMLPDCYPKTQVFAYGGSTLGFGESVPRDDWSSPGPTFEMTRGTTAHVTWVNNIKIPHLFPIDPTLHWANPKHLPAPKGPFDGGGDFPIDPEVQSPVPIVTHVHGLEVKSDFDGGPEEWFTPTSKPNGVTYEYPNSQPATTLWYHDHTLGITRLNVYAGLAGFYIIRDPNDPIEYPSSGASALPTGKYEMPLVIQDRSFKDDGSLDYPAYPSKDHPYWVGGSGGNVMVVNGKVWPKMDVERTRYRFRILNGSNFNTLTLTLPGLPLSEQFPFTVIGSDGGYLAAPAGTETLLLAPAERADIIVDFSKLSPGQAVVLQSDGQDIVQFKALDKEVPKTPTCSLQVPDPSDTSKPAACFSKLNTIPELRPTSTEKRTVTLVGAHDDGFLLNGRSFHSSVVDEQPKLGTTEDWEIVNMTSMPHPIHLHLVQFQVLDRQEIDTARYIKDWNEANDGGTVPLAKPANNPSADAYVLPKTLMTPSVLDSGWKDTVMAPPEHVTRIRVRWTPQDKASFPFDATQGPGYVWHCHMLEHEDNDMMRPLVVVK